jgi:hypothetical protein
MGADLLLAEPTAGLQWPWVSAQVDALALAQLSKADEAARVLSATPVGTLPELRNAVAGRSRTAVRLMSAMSRIVDDPHEADVVRDGMAVTLARLRIIAGQPEIAEELVTLNQTRLSAFCIGLSDLLWILRSTGERQPVLSGQLRALCQQKGPKTALPIEPPECTLGEQNKGP